MAKKCNAKTVQSLRNYWKPGNIVNRENAKRFRTWLKKHAEGLDIATFIHSSHHETSHVKTVSALIK